MPSLTSSLPTAHQVQLERDADDQRSHDELAAMHHDATRAAQRRDSAHAAALTACHTELAALRAQVQALSSVRASSLFTPLPSEPSTFFRHPSPLTSQPMRQDRLWHQRQLQHQRTHRGADPTCPTRSNRAELNAGDDVRSLADAG
jgi:hypothetical protein